MLLGHKIGLASAYYKPTVQDMLNEYMKAVNLLTINEENRLKQKVEILEIEKTQLATLKEDFEKLRNQVMKQQKRNGRIELPEIFYVKDAEVDQDGEKQDLGVYEARKLIGPKSYDDNWNLTRYTSELRNEKDDSFFAFIDFEGDEGSIKECPHCLEYGFHNKLYARQRKEGEPTAPDDDQFGSCHECGNTVPIHTAHYESEIKDSLETVQNPFENSESVFLSTDSSATTRRKRERKDGYRKGVHKYRSKRIDYDEHEDLEIQREIDKHGSDNVHIIQ